MKSQHTKASLLNDDEKSVVETINPKGKTPIVLICEHASKYIPKKLNGLGMSAEGLDSHAAWDIGAYELACNISELIDAPLVAARVSRLVYDCNRSPESKAGTPEKSEIYAVPGNENLSDIDYQQRVDEVYKPFHYAVSKAINKQINENKEPAIITIHSFTPVYFDEVRTLEIGVLHDTDDRLAKPLMLAIQNQTQYKVEFNLPYGVSDNVMHTVNKHANDRMLLNVMIEVKNDLLLNKEHIRRVATDLSKAISQAVAV